MCGINNNGLTWGKIAKTNRSEMRKLFFTPKVGFYLQYQPRTVWLRNLKQFMSTHVSNHTIRDIIGLIFFWRDWTSNIPSSIKRAKIQKWGQSCFSIFKKGAIKVMWADLTANECDLWEVNSSEHTTTANKCTSSSWLVRQQNKGRQSDGVHRQTDMVPIFEIIYY